MDPDETHDDPWEQPPLPGMESTTQYSTQMSGVTVKAKMGNSYRASGGNGGYATGVAYTSGPVLSEARLRETLNEILKERMDAFFQQIMDRIDQLEDRLP